VHASERVFLDEPFEAFDAQRELSQSQRSFAGETSFAEPLEVFGQGVLRTVDDPQVFPAPALHRGLQKATRARRHERHRLDDRALAASLCQSFPPGRHRSLACGIRKVDDVVRRAHQQRVILRHDACDRVHVPDVILVHVDRAFSRHDVKGSHADVPKRFDWPAVVAVRPREALREIQTDPMTVEQRTDVDAASGSLFECVNGLAQTDPRRRSNRGVLLPDELERLRGPRHQLAIEAHPIRVEALPELVSIECTPKRREQLSVERDVLEEATSRTRVADAIVRFEDSKPLARRLLVSAHDDDGA
jgi:hypothetical protein